MPDLNSPFWNSAFWFFLLAMASVIQTVLAQRAAAQARHDRRDEAAKTEASRQSVAARAEEVAAVARGAADRVREVAVAAGTTADKVELVRREAKEAALKLAEAVAAAGADAAERVAEVKATLRAAAEKVAEVERTLKATDAARDIRLSEIQDTGDRVHVLVNNNMSLALKANAALSRKIADLEPTEANRHAAQAAQQASDEHERKQAELNRIEARIDKEGFVRTRRPEAPPAKPEEGV